MYKSIKKKALLSALLSLGRLKFIHQESIISEIARGTVQKIFHKMYFGGKGAIFLLLEEKYSFYSPSKMLYIARVNVNEYNANNGAGKNFLNQFIKLIFKIRNIIEKRKIKNVFLHEKFLIIH